jgi:hypothetical protein
MNDFENWARDFSRLWEDATRQTEVWAEETLQGVAETADAIADELEKQLAPTLEQWADELNRSLEPLETVLDQEAERFSEEFAEFVTPIVEPMAIALESWIDALAAPVASHIDPVINDHPTCIGCKHYYGQAHGGNMLVCAMYPYGPETESCPDWESFGSS